ncbi:3204_t:CDS:1, partial [Gigaspora rosea]
VSSRFNEARSDNVSAKDKLHEYYSFQYSGYNNSIINEVCPENVDANNEIQPEDTNKVYSDDCGQQGDELDD